jgi:hypothetical protein
MSGNERLRRELEDASGLRVVPEYRMRLETLRKKYGHAIAILDDGASEIARFNCFAYALRVWDDPIYRQFVDEWQSSSLINSDLVSEMSRSGDFVELPEAIVQPDDIVLYFAGEELCHAGIVEEASSPLIIRSKWGGNEVHRHKLWEVPAYHGDRVRFYRRPDREIVFARLRARCEALS